MDRLNFIASLSSGAKILCDIGCDHAYAIEIALTKYNVDRGLACDVNEGPLACAKRNIITKGLEDRVDFILSDGFKNVNSNFDTAIISGMGGILITNILLSSINKIKDKTLILSPNTDVNLVRKFLSTHNFEIIEEYAIIDQGKYYEIIKATPGNCKLTPFEIEFGPILLKNRPEAFIKNIEKKYNQFRSIIDNIKNEEEKNNIRNKLISYKEVLNGKGIYK